MFVAHPQVTTYSVDLKPRTTTYGGGSTPTTIVKQEQSGEEMELFLGEQPWGNACSNRADACHA